MTNNNVLLLIFVKKAKSRPSTSMTIKEDVGSDDGVDNIYARELNMYENNSMGGNAYVHLLVVSKDKTTKFHFSMRVTTHFIRLKTLCCEKLGIHLTNQ